MGNGEWGMGWRMAIDRNRESGSAIRTQKVEPQRWQVIIFTLCLMALITLTSVMVVMVVMVVGRGGRRTIVAPLGVGHSVAMANDVDGRVGGKCANCVLACCLLLAWLNLDNPERSTSLMLQAEFRTGRPHPPQPLPFFYSLSILPPLSRLFRQE